MTINVFDGCPMSGWTHLDGARATSQAGPTTPALFGSAHFSIRKCVSVHRLRHLGDTLPVRLLAIVTAFLT